MELYYAFRWASISKKEDWIDRLAMLGVIEEEDYHREVGKIHHIPKCCREWFIYLTNMESWLQIDPLFFTDERYGRDKLQEEFWYVRCPDCRKESV